MTLSGKDVLLVGQSFQTPHHLADQLERWGFRRHFAASIRAACQLLSSVRVDVVFSDMHLPDGTGFGVLAVLARRCLPSFACLLKRVVFGCPLSMLEKIAWDR